MSNAAVISDDQVTDCSDKAAPESKPGNAGYAKAVPRDNDKLASKDKPCLKVDLTSDASAEPKKVSKVLVQGNVRKVTVEGKESGSKKPKVILKDVAVPEGGVIRLPSAEELEEIKIIFESPKSNDKNYKAVLSIFACGHFPGEEKELYSFFLCFAKVTNCLCIYGVPWR